MSVWVRSAGVSGLCEWLYNWFIGLRCGEAIYMTSRRRVAAPVAPLATQQQGICLFHDTTQERQQHQTRRSQYDKCTRKCVSVRAVYVIMYTVPQT